MPYRKLEVPSLSPPVLFKIHFNTTIPPTLRSSTFSLSVNFHNSLSCTHFSSIASVQQVLVNPIFIRLHKNLLRVQIIFQCSANYHFHLGPDISLNTTFSNTLILWFSLNVRDSFTPTQNNTQNQVLYIFIFITNKTKLTSRRSFTLGSRSRNSAPVRKKKLDYTLASLTKLLQQASQEVNPNLTKG